MHNSRQAKVVRCCIQREGMVERYGRYLPGSQEAKFFAMQWKQRISHVEPQPAGFELWWCLRKRLWLILAHLPSRYLLPWHSWLPLSRHFFLENYGKILRSFCFQVEVNATLERSFNWEGEGMTFWVPPIILLYVTCSEMNIFGKSRMSS